MIKGVFGVIMAVILLAVICAPIIVFFTVGWKYALLTYFIQTACLYTLRGITLAIKESLGK